MEVEKAESLELRNIYLFCCIVRHLADYSIVMKTLGWSLIVINFLLC
jgi:hypothetical protein